MYTNLITLYIVYIVYSIYYIQTWLSLYWNLHVNYNEHIKPLAKLSIQL